MNKYKTDLCENFEKYGKCKYGNNCQFAHGMEELRKKKVPKSYKTVLCDNWVRYGKCRYGSKCKFIHNKAIINDTMKEKIKTNNKYKTKTCKYYLQKKPCPFGENCGFIHPPKKKIIDFDIIKGCIPIIKRSSSDEFETSSRLHKWTKGLN